MYGIGDIYITLSDDNPEDRFGGKWEKIEGRFLLSSSSTYKLGTTGGEATHKLTVAEMPAHSHYITYGYPLLTAAGGSNMWAPRDNTNFNTNSVGGSQPHNNMPPYLVVNVWKRIA